MFIYHGIPWFLFLMNYEAVFTVNVVFEKYNVEIIDKPIRMFCETTGKVSSFRFLPRTGMIYPLFLGQEALAEIAYNSEPDK